MVATYYHYLLAIVKSITCISSEIYFYHIDMTKWCVIKNCPNKQLKRMKKSTILHKFPRDPDTSKKWEDWVNTVNELNSFTVSKKKFKVYTDAVLCNFHFDSSCYKFRQLQQGSVPSIHLSNKPSVSTDNFINQSKTSMADEMNRNEECTVQKTSTKLQRKCYIGDLSENDFSTPRRRRRSFNIMQQHFQKIQKRLKIVNHTCRRLSIKNIKLTCMLHKLEKKRYITPGTFDTLQNCFSGPIVAVINRALT